MNQIVYFIINIVNTTNLLIVKGFIILLSKLIPDDNINDLSIFITKVLSANCDNNFIWLVICLYNEILQYLYLLQRIKRK